MGTAAHDQNRTRPIPDRDRPPARPHRAPPPRDADAGGTGRVRADAEIETLDAFDAAAEAGALSGRRFQALDLTDRTLALLAADTSASVFLGCAMTADADTKVRADGALVFPPVPALPFDPYRAALYTADELYADLDAGYHRTPDARAYAWFRESLGDGDVLSSMLRAIHDDAVSDALDEHLVGREVVGVMGGHALVRGGSEYARAAALGRALSRSGLTVATGGGPGAMEAANLGAWLAPAPDSALPEALARLAEAPSFSPSIGDWARAAFAVRRAHPEGGPSVAIPTWFYGHEPPNPFATHIAKYFANATREDGLLARSTAGVIFLPGAAGTVQEVFDTATANYYGSRGEPSPMILVGRAHWTKELPVWPLLTALAKGRPMAARIALVDSPDEVPAMLTRLRAT
ncbi:LOG family protein [Streptomyces sp. BI20]|uniref:LOG family protein n=1 Tax=Streptomyces sp. BI20 TaxID=3403460 RepID=UPI003C74ED59